MSKDKKQRLELTWIGKGNEPRLEPRILIEDAEKSYGDKQTENMLIHGDNLLALKALEQDFSGKIKCIYIDPPYNTGSAFEHYDDGLEHSQWLSLMSPRLKILNRLLKEDGCIWISIDDNEAHYLKILCDEIFGRSNFIANVVWEKADSPRMDAIYFSSRHDHILVYAKNKNILKFEREALREDLPDHYNKQDKNGRPYYLKPLRAMGGQGDTRAARPNLFYALKAPNGDEIYPIKSDGVDGAWRWGKDKVENESERIEWVDGKSGWVPYYRIYGDDRKIRPPETIWKHTEAGSNRNAKAEIKAIFKQESGFDTPKPEKLLERIIALTANENEWVLDSFLGSGTTTAVAHKMNRKWIGIELGEHAHTHCLPRMKKVVDGLDQGGISQSQDWKGGGGLKFYNLAPSLLKKDDFGNWIIDTCYNADMLAAAMTKHEGYHYSPDELLFWKQGQSTEQDFIFTTTQFVTVEFLDKIHEQMKDGESLLICCKSFQEVCEKKYENINVKKIPNMLLGRCEFGKEDYSLNIIPMPTDENEEPFVPAAQKIAEEHEAEVMRKQGKQSKLF